jgi:hypothetical protein
LLFVFGSKAELVQALLARAREDELELLSGVRGASCGAEISDVAHELWRWLGAEEHRALLTLWVEGYATSLIRPHGPWAGFARATVDDWLSLLADAQPTRHRNSITGQVERTLVLAVLRGAMLDLLATHNLERTTAAVHEQLRLLRQTKRSSRTARARAAGEHH